MTDSSPTSIKQLFKTEYSALQKIFHKVQQLNQVNDVLMQSIDPRLAKHCLVANIYIDRLIVLVENAAIATQFRFCIPDLLPQLKKHPLLRDIKTIECKLSPLPMVLF